MTKENKVDWIIHLVANGVSCAKCGEVENNFPQYICDAHTHGMDKYGHMEFQLVINYGMEHVCYLLNSLGRRVQNGERFKSGDVVKGLYEDCDITLHSIPDSNGVHVLRLIIPDKKNRMPSDGADYPYNMQYHLLEELYQFGKTSSSLPN